MENFLKPHYPDDGFTRVEICKFDYTIQSNVFGISYLYLILGGEVQEKPCSSRHLVQYYTKLELILVVSCILQISTS